MRIFGDLCRLVTLQVHLCSRGLLSAVLPRVSHITNPFTIALMFDTLSCNRRNRFIIFIVVVVVVFFSAVGFALVTEGGTIFDDFSPPLTRLSTFSSSTSTAISQVMVPGLFATRAASINSLCGFLCCEVAARLKKNMSFLFCSLSLHFGVWRSDGKISHL